MPLMHVLFTALAVAAATSALAGAAASADTLLCWCPALRSPARAPAQTNERAPERQRSNKPKYDKNAIYERAAQYTTHVYYL